MKTLPKTLIAATLATVVGVGIYEMRQASHLRQEVQDLREQQALTEHRNEQLQLKRDEGLKQLAAVNGGNAQFKSGQNQSELLKLRGQVAVLKNSQPQQVNDPTELAAKAWTAKVNSIKQYLEQNPSETIPEIQLANERAWLTSIDPSAPYWGLETESEYRQVSEILRSAAEEQFGSKIAKALMDFYEVNNGQFPTELSQLQPYCDPDVGKILVDHYKIAPATIAQDVPTTKATGFTRGNDARVVGDWVITRKVRVNSNSTSRLAIFTGGSTWWQSPPGSDD